MKPRLSHSRIYVFQTLSLLNEKVIKSILLVYFRDSGKRIFPFVNPVRHPLVRPFLYFGCFCLCKLFKTMFMRNSVKAFICFQGFNLSYARHIHEACQFLSGKRLRGVEAPRKTGTALLFLLFWL